MNFFINLNNLYLLLYIYIKFNRILKMARTIADLEAKENIELKHLTLALQYRVDVN